MKKVGQRRATKRIAVVATRERARAARRCVEQVVEERHAREGEEGDRELGGRESREAPSQRQAVGEVAAREAPEPEARHERRDDDGDRVHVGAAEEGEEALPDHLVEQRGEPAHEEDGEEEAAAESGHSRPF